MAKKSVRLSKKQQLKAIFGVARLSFKTAPLAVMFKLGGAVIDAVLPIITTYFAALTTTALVNAYAGNSVAGTTAIRYMLVTAVLGLIMTMWRSMDSYVQTKMRFLVEARVSDQMYSHFLALDFWQYDNKEIVDLYDRAQKFSNFFAYIFDRIASIISQLIGIISAVIALAIFQPILAIFVLVAISPGVYLQLKLSRKQVANWNENVEVRRAKNMLEWHLSEPNQIAELRLYGMVNFMMTHRARLRDIDEKERIEFEREYMPKRLLADALEAATEVGSLVWTALQIIAHRQPVGLFLYVQQVVSRAIGSASSFVSTLGSIDEDIANLFDYEQFMKLPISTTGKKIMMTPPQVIAFKDVSFSYPTAGKEQALKNVSFQIQAHQHIAIVGENGAGKSTLIKLLTGLYRPTSGHILVDDMDLAEFSAASWHKQLGVLQQSFIKYNFATAGDNVRFGSVDEKSTQERLHKALAEAEADGFVTKLPKGADTYVNTWMEDNEGIKGVELSGGQLQRLVLARDFYRNAPIVILDEPTSAIDALAEARIFKRLFADKKRTVITISHRMSTVEQADIIFMLENGQLVETGTHDTLVKKKGRYYRMFEAQLTK